MFLVKKLDPALRKEKKKKTGSNTNYKISELWLHNRP